MTSLLPSGEAYAPLISQDHLTPQIQRKQATEPNGGVTFFVGLPTGQSIKLESVDLGAQPLSGAADPKKLRPGDPNAGLKTAAGLLPREEKAPKTRHPAKKASEQLKVIEKQGARQNWGGGGGKPSAESAPQRRSAKDSLL